LYFGGESIRGFIFAMLSVLLLELILHYLLQPSIGRYNSQEKIKLIEKQHQES
jgi:hypothetical protein